MVKCVKDDITRKHSHFSQTMIIEVYNSHVKLNKILIMNLALTQRSIDCPHVAKLYEYL